MWASHVTALRALQTVVPVFEGAGIETLAVKGVVTAHLLYADPNHRPLSDVDLRIRREDYERAIRIAEREGWRITERMPEYGAFVVFVGSLGLSVDVETVVGAPGYCAVSIGEMLSRATRTVLGAEIRVPEIHDHAVLMCVNVFKDKIVLAPPWSLEDARRIVAVEGFDVDRFVERARRAKIACIAWMVADWMEREKGSAVWSAVKARLGGERGPRRFYAWALRWLYERGATSMSTRIMVRAGADDPRMWLDCLWAAFRHEMARGRSMGP